MFNSNSGSTTNKPWAKDSWRPNAEPSASSDRYFVLIYLTKMKVIINVCFKDGPQQIQHVIRVLDQEEDSQATRISIWYQLVHLRQG